MKTCENCAWYCHADGKCYGNPFLMSGMEIGAALTVPADQGACCDWAFDGLEDWEREDCKLEETLMTMEVM